MKTVRTARPRTSAFVLIACALLLSACGPSYPPERPDPSNAREHAAYLAEDVRRSGPGYPDLDGKVFNYAYEGFAAFRVLVARNRLLFEGVSGEFEGVRMLQVPQISRVDDGIYFMSWQVRGDMGDNVLVNTVDMKVFGHLGAGSDYRQIHGDIACFGTTQECDAPAGEPQSVIGGIARVMLRRLFGSDADGDSSSPAQPGAHALDNLSLVYALPDGEAVSLRIENGGVLVEEAGQFIARGGVVTQAADQIYLVSWDGDHGGQHIVFNARTMEIHDQIATDGTRVALQGRASYFGPIADAI